MVKKNDLFLPEEDLADRRRFFSGLITGLIITILVLSFFLFAKRFF